MKKVVVASLLAVASIALVPQNGVAQTQVNLGSNAQASSAGIQMSPAEYKAYNDAISQTDPKAKAAALEAYLTAYPQSPVKADTLQQLMLTYSAFDPAKTLSTADRLLQVDPSNLRALTFEVYFRRQAADQQTDPAAKQAALDQAADFAQKGLAATKPKDMSDDDFAKVKAAATPVFYSAIAIAALNKKDYATAIDNFKKELASVPPEQTTTPGPILQDTYTLGLAYYQSNPPDYVNCTWYTSRAAAFAPEPYKSQMLPTAKFCYKKYHGADDGYDAVLAAAQTSLNPPAGFTIKAAPSPADIVAQVIQSTPDLSTLAISDKEFILQNGKPEDAAKVWDTMKGKTVQLPNVTVITASDSVITAAVSDDAVQSKTADFTFNLKAPLKTVPAVGATVNMIGTYSSYTVGGVTRGTATSSGTDTSAAAAPATGAAAPATGAAPAAAPAAAGGPAGPVMIIMNDAEVVEPKKAPVKKATPAHHPAARKK
jgi:tetratricopeptide (TPR) repeat protein